jgi:hypothetical protein
MYSSKMIPLEEEVVIREPRNCPSLVKIITNLSREQLAKEGWWNGSGGRVPA